MGEHAMQDHSSEAVALARLRVDRKHGQGTFDSLRSLVESMGGERGAGAAVEKDLSDRLAQAVEDIRDVLAVTGLARPTVETRLIDMSIDDLRELAIAHLVEAVPAGTFRTGTVLPLPTPDPRVPEVMREAMAPETMNVPLLVETALFMVERLVRDEGRPGVALLFRFEWHGLLADLRENRTWRMLVGRTDESGHLALGIVATADGQRSLFLAPLESPETWQTITYGRVQDALKGFTFARDR